MSGGHTRGGVRAMCGRPVPRRRGPGRPLGGPLARHVLFLVACALPAATACERPDPIPPPELEAAAPPAGVAFPPPGASLDTQPRRTPEEAGFRPGVVEALEAVILRDRWALWRHGHLLHVEGDFLRTTEIKSAAKSFHAALVGAAIAQGRIASVDDDIAPFAPALTGRGITWRHLMTQTSGLHDPEVRPGSLFVYHETNPTLLCHALARVWGREGYFDGYADVIASALLDPIGARGWSTMVREDGVRLVMHLEHLGRFGLLMVTGGVWEGRRVLPEDFVRELGAKQTRGIPVDYDVRPKPLMPRVISGLRAEDFPEAPYGYLTWTTTDCDLWPDASPAWAAAHGAGNHIVAWNPETGVVFAILRGRFQEVPGQPPGWPVPMAPALAAIDAHLATR
jgi:CubicO group peptidase (beta-lactamase class C family)